MITANDVITTGTRPARKSGDRKRTRDVVNSKEKKNRFTLELPESVNIVLDDLKQKSGLTSRTDAIIAAIVLCDWAMQHVLDGRTIAAVSEEKKSYITLESPIFRLAKALKDVK